MGTYCSHLLMPFSRLISLIWPAYSNYDKFLTKYNSAGSFKTTYQVPEDYNRTPSPKLTWDNYILDEDIPRVMNTYYNRIPGRDFAASNCDTKSVHFSPPYEEVAMQYGFGHPASSNKKTT